MGFTEGEWSVQNKGTLGTRSARCEVVKGKVNLSNLDHIPHNPTVCRMPDLSAESYANAHLIAAAPRMAELLTKLLDVSFDTDDENYEELRPLLEDAQDILSGVKNE